jgi:hypothetical protein
LCGPVAFPVAKLVIGNTLPEERDRISNRQRSYYLGRFATAQEAHAAYAAAARELYGEFARTE